MIPGKLHFGINKTSKRTHMSALVADFVIFLSWRYTLTF